MNDFLSILTILGLIELLFTFLTGIPFALTRLAIFSLNKKYFRKKWICRLIQTYDWKYFEQTFKISEDSDERILRHYPNKEFKCLYRECQITGLKQREILPRCNGMSSWRKCNMKDNQTIKLKRI